MNENREEKNENSEDKEKQKSLQNDDQEILKNRDPKEGSSPISDAGKKREEGKRYQ
jgi:hypothetical protein